MTTRDNQIHRGFEAGNYANAYETEDYEQALEALPSNRSSAYIEAFTLGFFSSYEIEEMGEHADVYLQALYGATGKRAAELGITVPSEGDYETHNCCEPDGI